MIVSYARVRSRDVTTIMQWRDVRDSPVHYGGDGAELLELEGTRGTGDLHHEVYRADGAEPVGVLERGYRSAHREHRSGIYLKYCM